MMGSYDHIWAKSEMRGAVSLAMHLRQTAICAVYIAGWMGLDPRIARLGALLHDIGKASILFQNFLRQNATYPFPFRFRHEIASLFFLSLVEKAERPFVLEMVIAHHKSLSGDKRNLGLLIWKIGKTIILSYMPGDSNSGVKMLWVFCRS